MAGGVVSLPERSIDVLLDEMVRRLVAQGHLRTKRMEDAFRGVPRHLFLPHVPADVVYSGEAVVTRTGVDGNPTSSSSMPAIMAIMLEQLDVQAGHRVLEIGTGTGYNAAVLAWLTGAEGAVTTVDIDADIVQEARGRLDAAGYGAVATIAGDGWLGVPARAPYDRIVVTVGLWDLSPLWLAQLVDDGVLVVPLWLGPGVQLSVAFRKDGQRLRSVTVEPCGFMRLRGPHAGPEGYVCLHGWTVSLDDPTPERVSVLADLLQMEPRLEPAPTVPRGWCARLGLEEPRAVFLARQDNWRDGGCGVLDVEQRSLAALRGTWLQTFGGDAARGILLSRLIGGRPLETRTLTIEAVPSTLPPPAGNDAVLRRPNFQFRLREGVSSVS